MPDYLPLSLVHEVHRAILQLDIDRHALLTGTKVMAHLRTSSRPNEQLLLDLQGLNEWRSRDGSIPLRTMLENAYHLREERAGAEVLEKALLAIANVAVRAETPGHRATRPATLTFLLAAPRDLARSDVSTEMRAITDVIRASATRDAFVCEIVLAARAEDLPNVVHHADPALVHFSGHGDKHAHLLFEGKNGRAAPVAPATLAGVFQLAKGRVRCVVLNACTTAPAAEAITAHVDVAIGGAGELDEGAALAFSEGFYGAIGQGKSVGEAFDAGNACVEIAGFERDALRMFARAGVDPTTVYLKR